MPFPFDWLGLGWTPALPTRHLILRRSAEPSLEGGLQPAARSLEGSFEAPGRGTSKAVSLSISDFIDPNKINDLGRGKMPKIRFTHSLSG